MKHPIILLTTCFLVFISCSSVDQDLTSLTASLQSNSFPTNEELMYDSVLMAVWYGLIDLSADQDFRDTVYDLCSDTFDGDYNIVLKKLSESWDSLGSDMKSSIATHHSYPNNLIKYVDTAIVGFAYNNGVAFPQIYIPFFENVSNNTTPWLGLALEDTTEVPGHKKVGITLSTIVLDEAYATENYSWICSMNESLLSNNDYSTYYGIGYSTIESTDSTSDTIITTTTSQLLKISHPIINDMPDGKLRKFGTENVGILLTKGKFKTKKEGWVSGRSDIKWIGGKWNDFQPGHFVKSVGVVQKLRSKERNKWVGIRIQDLARIGANDPYKFDMNAWVLFYEYDRRAKFKRQVTVNSFERIGPNSNTYSFQSKQSAYGDINMHWVWWQFASGLINTLDCNMNDSGNRIIFTASTET